MRAGRGAAGCGILPGGQAAVHRSDVSREVLPNRPAGQRRGVEQFCGHQEPGAVSLHASVVAEKRPAAHGDGSIVPTSGQMKPASTRARGKVLMKGWKAGERPHLISPGVQSLQLEEAAGYIVLAKVPVCAAVHVSLRFRSTRG